MTVNTAMIKGLTYDCVWIADIVSNELVSLPAGEEAILLTDSSQKMTIKLKKGQNIFLRRMRGVGFFSNLYGQYLILNALDSCLH